LLEWFCPDIFIKDIHQLTPEFLKNFGIKGIIIDLDNTLVAWNQKKVDEKLLNWFKVMKSNGEKLFNRPVIKHKSASPINSPPTVTLNYMNSTGLKCMSEVNCSIVFYGINVNYLKLFVRLFL
jgi:predicted HAD superfamily phosphohydrolase YqeG